MEIQKTNINSDTKILLFIGMKLVLLNERIFLLFFENFMKIFSKYFFEIFFMIFYYFILT